MRNATDIMAQVIEGLNMGTKDDLHKLVYDLSVIPEKPRSLTVKEYMNLNHPEIIPMNKVPCHISDEVVNNDPADVPEAIDNTYDVIIPIKACVVVTVKAENELSAIQEAQAVYDKTDLVDVVFDLKKAEVF